MRLILAGILSAILLIGAVGTWYVFRGDISPKTLRIAAGPKGGDSYTLMNEIAEVAVRQSETLRLEVLPTTNSSVNIGHLHRGEVDLATVEANTPAYSSIQLVTDLFADYFLLITRKDSGIREVSDLPGKRIAIPEEGSSGSLSFWSVIAHYRLPPEGFRTRSVERDRGVELFIKGEVDGMFLVASLLDPFVVSFIEELRQRGVSTRFVPIDQGRAMALKRPFLEPATVVRGTFDGAGPVPEGPIETVSVRRLLVSRADANVDDIRELVRIIFDHRLDLLIRMPLSASITGQVDEASVSLPTHPGAQAFYDRDKPSFIQENAEPLALMVTVFAMLLSALLALRRSMSAKAKNRADFFNERLLAIAAQARNPESFDQLEELKLELSSMLEEVVHALDTDQVTEEGFQSFAFLWNSVRDEVNEQRLKSD